mgnify:CR=1 FL=1
MVTVFVYSDNLRKIKKILKMTTEELASSLDMSSATLTSYERNVRKPSIDLVIQLYQKLNININWFISQQGPMFITNNDLKRMQNNIAISPEITGRHYQDIQEVNGYTDTQMAQILKISDKRYRELSLGKDFPNIAEQNNTKLNFNVDMDWFLYGEAGQKSPGTIDNQLSGVSLPQLTPEQYAKLIKLLDQQ